MCLSVLQEGEGLGHRGGWIFVTIGGVIMGMLGRLLCVLVVAMMFSACGGASKSAHEKADAAMYKPIEYENTSVQGPAVVVMPGVVKSRSVYFLGKYGDSNIKDFAEIELGKANFTLVESADKQPMFTEMACAVNLGDPQALRLFKNKCAPKAKCFVTFDVIEAEPVAWEVKGGSGEVAGMLIELGFLIANKGESSALGKSLGTAVSSLKKYDYKTTWNVTLRYKVVDAFEGKELCSNEIKEQHVVESQMSSAIGVTNTETGNMTMDTLIQRLIQRAVHEIDKNHKQAMLAVEEPKGKGKVVVKNEKKIAKEYAEKLAELEKKKDQERAVDAMRSWMFAYSTLDPQGVLMLSSKDIHERIAKEMGPLLQTPEKMPNWRDKFTIDVSGVNYELLEYSPEKCKVKTSGTIRFGDKGKEKDYSAVDVTDVVKVDGAWKVASLKTKKVE